MYKILFGIKEFSIRKKFIMFSAVALIAILAVQLYYYLRITRTTKEMVDDYTDSIVLQAVNSIDRMLTGAQQVAYHFSYGSLIEDYLSPKSNYQLYNMWGYQADMVRTAVETNSDIFDIAFFRTDGYIRYQFRNYNFEVRSILDKYEDELLTQETKAGFVCLVGSENQDIHIPAYVQPIYHTSTPINMGKIIGVCVVMLYPEMLNDLLVDIPTNSNSAFYLVDSNGYVVSGTRAAPDDMELFLNQSSVIVREVGDTGWQLVCDIDTKSEVDNYRFFSSFALVVAVFMFLFLGFLLRTINQNIVSPIHRLHSEIEYVISRNFSKRINMPYNDEIGGIAKAINMMIDHQAETTKQILITQQSLYEAQLEVTQNELLALQNQVNPHFLLNTLQCICGIAVANNTPMIANITSNLADIFNYSLRGKDEVTLADEIHCLRQYLSIIDIRFDSAFTWEIDIPQRLMTQRIAKMVLQPLTENAIYHGLERKGTGSLIISVKEAEGNVSIIIEDDGLGIEANRLLQIQNILSHKELMYKESIEHKRIGVANTCWRLKLMFGDEYGLKISSIMDKGTKVHINIPLEN